MSNKEYMTAEGLDTLRERLLTLEKKLEDLRIFKGKEAIHAGDTWHDNPLLYETEARERVLMKDIAEVRAKIQQAEIIETPANTSAVALGSKVEARFSDGSVEVYQILGEADSNPSAGIISYKSPLGRALLNRSPGERVVYEVGELVEEVQILSIEA